MKSSLLLVSGLFAFMISCGNQDASTVSEDAVQNKSDVVLMSEDQSIVLNMEIFSKTEISLYAEVRAVYDFNGHDTDIYLAKSGNMTRYLTRQADESYVESLKLSYQISGAEIADLVDAKRPPGASVKSVILILRSGVNFFSRSSTTYSRTVMNANDADMLTASNSIKESLKNHLPDMDVAKSTFKVGIQESPSNIAAK